MKNRTNVLSGLLLLGFCAIGAYSVSQIPVQDAAIEQVGATRSHHYFSISYCF